MLGETPVTVEGVFEMLMGAMRSEQEFVEEFARRAEFFRAAEAQARCGALAAFRDALRARLTLENESEGRSWNENPE